MGSAVDILLCDLDAFFASVEQRDHPEYRGKPVIVGGDPDGRGVVSTCSYEARTFGVRSAMPMKTAVRLCPQAVLLPPDLRRYREVSQQAISIYERFTPDIEQVSIDEAYLAVPAGDGVEVGEAIRRSVRQELQLPLSIGVSENKLLAKIGCSLAKPDGLRELRRSEVRAVLWPLPVEVLPGAGPKTVKKLSRLGIHTVGDLAAYPEEVLERALGSWGKELRLYALGIDQRTLERERPVKSIGEETTFAQDIADPEAALAQLMLLAEEVGFRLRRKGLRARTITLKYRRPDFSTFTRSRTLPASVNTDMAIYKVAEELFWTHAYPPPWRLLGIQASNLVEQEWKQETLFPEDGFGTGTGNRLVEQPASLTGPVAQGGRSARSREETLAAISDSLRVRYGKGVLHRARVLMGKEARS
ncbi:MAG: DNA polymerase IV [Clostridia bacterium]|nr:DNA polymerase IV [Clostridia bacterium]